MEQKITQCEWCPFIYNTPHEFECKHPKSTDKMQSKVQRRSKLPKECPLKTYPVTFTC